MFFYTGLAAGMLASFNLTTLFVGGMLASTTLFFEWASTNSLLLATR
jgi:hypothetical protein